MGLGSSIAISLKCSVNNIGTLVQKVWHDWLRSRSVPSNVSGLSIPVSVYSSVVLMEHWVLSGLPLSVHVREGSCLWRSSSQVPDCQVRVVQERLHVEGMVIETKRS